MTDARQGPDTRPLVIDLMSRDPDYYFVLTQALGDFAAGCRGEAADGVNPESSRKWAEAAEALLAQAEEALGKPRCAYCGERAGEVCGGSPFTDSIISWGDVQPGDLVLNGGGLVMVSSIDVLPQDGHPDFLIAYIGGWHVNEDGSPGRAVYMSPPAAPLTAVRRPREGCRSNG